MLTNAVWCGEFAGVLLGNGRLLREEKYKDFESGAIRPKELVP